MCYFRNYSLRKFVRKLGFIVAVSPIMLSFIAIIFYFLGCYNILSIDVEVGRLFIASFVWLTFCVFFNFIYDELMG